MNRLEYNQIIKHFGSKKYSKCFVKDVDAAIKLFKRTIWKYHPQKTQCAKCRAKTSLTDISHRCLSCTINYCFPGIKEWNEQK